jgi:hypothetical protein
LKVLKINNIYFTCLHKCIFIVLYGLANIKQKNLPIKAPSNAALDSTKRTYICAGAPNEQHLMEKAAKHNDAALKMEIVKT